MVGKLPCLGYCLFLSICNFEPEIKAYYGISILFVLQDSSEFVFPFERLTE